MRTASAGYYFMPYSTFAALAKKVGTKVRAWTVAKADAYMECSVTSNDLSAAWSNQKNWKATGSCTAAGFACKSGNPSVGFSYASHYDAINPSCGHSIFTKVCIWVVLS